MTKPCLLLYLLSARIPHWWHEIQLGGGKGLSDKNLIAPAVSAANATLQSQQTKLTKLSGKVLDANGEPIIGASITENGTKNVTVTDIDGNFTLNANSSNATVTVTYVGFNTK